VAVLSPRLGRGSALSAPAVAYPDASALPSSRLNPRSAAPRPVIASAPRVEKLGGEAIRCPARAAPRHCERSEAIQHAGRPAFRAPIRRSARRAPRRFRWPFCPALAQSPPA
jgi:hypothetical protein